MPPLADASFSTAHIIEILLLVIILLLLLPGPWRRV